MSEAGSSATQPRGCNGVWNAVHRHTTGIPTSPAGYHGNCREGLLSGQNWRCVLNDPILSPKAAATQSGATELCPACHYPSSPAQPGAARSKAQVSAHGPGSQQSFPQCSEDWEAFSDPAWSSCCTKNFGAEFNPGGGTESSACHQAAAAGCPRCPACHGTACWDPAAGMLAVNAAL